MTSLYFCKRPFRQRDQDSRVHLQMQQLLLFRDELVFGIPSFLPISTQIPDSHYHVHSLSSPPCCHG
jgi:hypothetical protein